MTMRSSCLGLGLGIAALAAACSASIGETETSPGGSPAPGSAPAGNAPAGTAAPKPGDPLPPGTAPAPTPSAPAATCTTPGPQAAAAPVRRLTRREYDNTVSYLFGGLPTGSTNPARDFVLDAEPRGFENNADSPMTPLSAVQYAEAAERLARSLITAKLATLLPCSSAAADDNCAREFVGNFGKRAYRRPLTSAEADRLFGVYRNARTTLALPFAEGIRLVTQTMLQSPHFLNHIERGVPGATPQNGLVPLTPYEIASRLSYFLWTSMPDTTLFAAADANKLATPADIDAQVTRMLADPRARSTSGVLYFFRQWLDLDKLSKTDKSMTAFPAWTSVVKSSLGPSTERFVSEILWNGDAKLTTLLTAPTGYVNTALASLYGVADPGVAVTTSSMLVKADLDPTQRSGVLTLLSNLAIQAHGDQTSPVHRGLFVRERIMCETTPSPPADADVTVPRVNSRLTTRERFAMHSQQPTCAGCHRLMDPLGMGFEHYDAIGRWRTTEAGKPIDATGEVFGSRDLDGQFKGAIELGGKLVKSQAVRDCFASQWLDYAIAVPTQDLGCAVRQLSADFEKNGTDVKKLIHAVARSDAFRFRKAPEVCK